MQAGRLADEFPLERREPVGEAESGAPQKADRGSLRGEGTMKGHHPRRHCVIVPNPPPLLRAKIFDHAGITAAADRFTDDFRQQGGVQNAQIDPLPGQRVNGVGGITRQGDAMTDIGFRVVVVERKTSYLAGARKRTKPAFTGPLHR